MLKPILAFLASFTVSLAFLPFIIRFSAKKKLGAKPGRRRIHKRITPSLGGVAIFLGFTIGCLLFGFEPGSAVVYIVLPILIIPFIIGLLDDLVHLRPAAKLIAQLATGSLLFFILDIRLTSFYGLLGDNTFPPVVSFFVTIFSVVIVTNALNLIDGIDGLAAAFSLVACLAFGAWFYFTRQYPYALMCLSLSGGILAFLFKNWAPSNIFMGDTGSLVIGTLLSMMAIRFINANHALEPNHFKFSSSVVTAICVLIVPLVDTTRIIIIRLSKGISPFKADKRHIHHGLVRLGFSHQKAVYILTAIHVAIIALAVIFRTGNEWVLLGIIVATATALCVWLDHALLRVVRENVLPVDPPSKTG